MRYKMKPLVIEAYQMTSENRNAFSFWPEWLQKAYLEKSFRDIGSVFLTNPVNTNGTLSIRTSDGCVIVHNGDYIIQGVNGNIFSLEPDVFEATYEPVEEDDEV